MATIPDLNQDVSGVIYGCLDGYGRYRMSMVSKAWYSHCMSRIVPIKSRHDWDDAAMNVDVLRLLHKLANGYKMQYDKCYRICFILCGRCEIELIDILIRFNVIIPEECANITCLFGHVELFKLLLSRGGHSRGTLIQGFFGACEGNHKEIIQMCIDTGIECWTQGLYCAARGGHVDLFNEFMNKGAVIDLSVLRDAAHGGQLDILKIVLECVNDVDDIALMEACQQGHFEVTKLLLNKCNGIRPNNLFKWACSGGNMDLINYLMDLGISEWNLGLQGACQTGNIALAQLMIAKGASRQNGLLYVCENGNMALIDLLLPATVNEFHFTTACRCGNLNIVKRFVSIGTEFCDVGLDAAIQNRQDDIVEYLRSVVKN